MPTQRDYWPEWSLFLKKRGLESMAAWILEAGAPLALIGAQIVYIGKPFISPALSPNRVEALANLLEDREESQAFVTFLRNGAES